MCKPRRFVPVRTFLLALLGLVVSLPKGSSSLVLTPSGNTWERVGGARYLTSPVICSATGDSIFVCIVSCFRDLNCVAVNYHKTVEKTCELLSEGFLDSSSSQLTTSPGWSYYRQRWNENPCQSMPCPSDAYCMRYTPLLTQRFENQPGRYYACSRHTWLRDEHAVGRTKCRLVAMYEMDLHGGSFISSGSETTPQKMLDDHCLNFDCLAASYNLKSSIAWLNQEPHILKSNGGSLYTNPDFEYMYPECNYGN